MLIKSPRHKRVSKILPLCVKTLLRLTQLLVVTLLLYNSLWMYFNLTGKQLGVNDLGTICGENEKCKGNAIEGHGMKENPSSGASKRGREAKQPMMTKLVDTQKDESVNHAHGMKENPSNGASGRGRGAKEPMMTKLVDTQNDESINHADEGFETCIVLGFLSRSTESELRKWQRTEFSRQLDLLPKDLKKQVLLQQRFMIGINPEDSIMTEVMNEQSSHNDVKILRVNEGYTHLTANTWDSFHQLLPLMESPSCKSAFLVRADTDFVLNYERLARTIASMPKTSTYFGSFLPNFPTVDARVRQIGQLGRITLPLWALGGLYGFSTDIVKRLVQPEVERTVLKKDEMYIYREEDRAVGLALDRSNTTVENHLFTKATFHFCQPENFTCADYGHFMGFSVGFGKSGEGQDHYQMKIEQLGKISELWKQCEDTLAPFKVSDYYFKVDEQFRKDEPFKYVYYGCNIMSDRAQGDYNCWKTEYDLSLEEETHVDADNQCAERIYRETYPEVNDYIQNGTFTSGREHYLEIGYSDPSKHYFCPTVCNHDADCPALTKEELVECDTESRYLSDLPDIKDAVDKGTFRSSHDHYTSVGKSEGRLLLLFTWPPAPSNFTQ